jgi:hypothetical protein
MKISINGFTKTNKYGVVTIGKNFDRIIRGKNVTIGVYRKEHIEYMWRNGNWIGKPDKHVTKNFYTITIDGVNHSSPNMGRLELKFVLNHIGKI